jgi:hypothetical protein
MKRGYAAILPLFPASKFFQSDARLRVAAEIPTDGIVGFL